MALTDDPELQTSVGLIMDRYRLGRRLGAGGFGAVHEAIDERLDRTVAIKVIPGDGETPERARREAHAAARLEHPGIVAIFDAGEEDGTRYLVSELVEGRTLAQLEAEELTDRDALRIGLALCDALEHAHERGVVHRDIKPQNVLVPDRPRTWRGAAKLADFGIAMLAGDDPLTMTGDVIGTLAYMAPEQAAGKRVDHRVDIYALALVLYEALAGKNPIRGATPAATAKNVGKPIPSLAKHRKDLPEPLVSALDRALAVAPGQRITLEDLGDALEDALIEVADEGGTIVRHPSEGTWGVVPHGLPRLANAAAAGAASAAAVAVLGRPADLPWPVFALAAFALVWLLPRAGFLVAALATALALVVGPGMTTGGDGIAAAGTTLVVILACAPIPLVLASMPVGWSVPLLAPALGVVGLAGAFPAIAARSPFVLHRAAVGALGAWCLLLVEPLASRTLLLGPATGAPAGADAQEAVAIAADAVATTVTSGLPALLVIWALGAAVLPWLVRGASLTLDVVMATAWAAGMASATGVLAPWLGKALSVEEPKGLVAGAIVAGVFAVVEPRYSPSE